MILQQIPVSRLFSEKYLNSVLVLLIHLLTGGLIFRYSELSLRSSASRPGATGPSGSLFLPAITLLLSFSSESYVAIQCILSFRVLFVDCSSQVSSTGFLGPRGYSHLYSNHDLEKEWPHLIAFCLTASH